MTDQEKRLRLELAIANLRLANYLLDCLAKRHAERLAKQHAKVH